MKYVLYHLAPALPFVLFLVGIGLSVGPHVYWRRRSKRVVLPYRALPPEEP